MSHTVADLLAYFDEVAPFSYQESYDNTGLICGDPKLEITGVMTCLDATEGVIAEAIEQRCNVIVAHHPIIFSGLKKISPQHYIGRAIIKAIKGDVAIIAVHTNLDNVLDRGVNQRIADTIGLKELSILAPNHKLDDTGVVGAGVIGKLSAPLSAEVFLSLVKEKMRTGAVKYTKIVKGSISTVALCGGSGTFLLPHAIKAGADVYVTSDIKYHEFFEANDEIILVDIGHYESEQYTIELLAELIQNKFHTFAARCTKVQTNPVNYL